jgi:hypothetical protein
MPTDRVDIREFDGAKCVVLNTRCAWLLTLVLLRTAPEAVAVDGSYLARLLMATLPAAWGSVRLAVITWTSLLG